MCVQFDAVVDVREAAEVAEGMIPGAVHIPLGQVQANPDLKQFKVQRLRAQASSSARWRADQGGAHLRVCLWLSHCPTFHWLR